MKEIEQYVSKTITEAVDPFVLHEMINQTSAHIKDEQLVRVFLGVCVYNPKKTIISIDNGREDCDYCMDTHNPVEMMIVAYRYNNDDGIRTEIYVEDKEAEALAGY